MIKAFKEEKWTYKVMTVGLIAALVFFVFRVTYSAIVGMNYPSEMNEASNVALTRMFLAGKSPYVMGSLSYSEPAVNYEYPFMGSLLAAALSFVVGGNAVLAHYIISYVAFLGTGILGYFILKPLSKTTVAPLAGALLFLMCHWRFGYISAAPDDLGLFVFLLTLYCAISKKIKKKPLICAILTILCFYTKQYFVFVAVGIFIYMFLYSKKDAVKFLVSCVVIGAATGAIITFAWPLYWTYTIFFLYNGVFTGVGFGFGALFEQLKYLMAIFVALFVVLVIAIVRIIRLKKSGHQGKLFVVNENDPLALFVILIPVQFLPLILMGKNDGAFLSYFLQLWMPSIIVVTFAELEKMKKDDSRFVFDCFYGFVAAFTVLFGYLKMPLHTLSSEEIDNWKKAYAYIDEYRNQGDIIYSRHLAYKCFEDGGIYCLCGHDGEVSQLSLDTWNSSGLCQTLFPYADDIIVKNMNYIQSMVNRGRLGEFSLLTFEDGNSMMLSDEYLDIGTTYKKLDKLTLVTGNAPYEVSFYIRY